MPSSGIFSSLPAQTATVRCDVYLDSLGSLVLFLACGVGPAVIAYLVLDDLWQLAFPRQSPREPAVPTALVKPVSARRFGWLAWSAS